MSDPITIIETIVIGIGIIGNLLSIVIFSKKTFRNNSISTYCKALAICELWVIQQLIINIFILKQNILIYDQNDILCKFVYSFATYMASVQPWIMVAFSLDKLLSMRVSSIRLLKKKWFQWSVVAGIVLFTAALYIYVPIFIRIREVFPGYSICDVTSIGFFNTHIIVFLFETSLIPFIIMVISSILTIRLLIKSRKAVARNEQMTRDRKSKDRKYAITSIVYNISFIFLKLPLAIFYLLLAYYSIYDANLFTIANFLFYVNMSMDFFIHLLTNSIFRRELLVLLRLAKDNKASLSNTNTNSLTNRTIRKNQVSTIIN